MLCVQPGSRLNWREITCSAMESSAAATGWRHSINPFTYMLCTTHALLSFAVGAAIERCCCGSGSAGLWQEETLRLHSRLQLQQVQLSHTPSSHLTLLMHLHFVPHFSFILSLQAELEDARDDMQRMHLQVRFQLIGTSDTAAAAAVVVAAAAAAAAVVVAVAAAAAAAVLTLVSAAARSFNDDGGAVAEGQTLLLVLVLVLFLVLLLLRCCCWCRCCRERGAAQYPPAAIRIRGRCPRAATGAGVQIDLQQGSHCIPSHVSSAA